MPFYREMTSLYDKINNFFRRDCSYIRLVPLKPQLVPERTFLCEHLQKNSVTKSQNEPVKVPVECHDVISRNDKVNLYDKINNFFPK